MCNYFVAWTPQFSGEELTAFVTRVVLIGADPFLLGGFIASFIAWALSDKSRQKCLIAAGSMNIIGGIENKSVGFACKNLKVCSN